jgi:very-short-patch-repair endonuclease
MSGKRVIDNFDNLIDRYLAGSSMKQLSDEIGFARKSLAERFVAAGVPLRGRSDAERLKWRGIKERGAGAIARQTSAAQTARRGQRDSLAVRLARAKTFHERLLRIGKFEEAIANALRDRGFIVAQQFDIGADNVDLAVRELRIAVEIQSNNHLGPQSSIRPERLERILDAGWAMVVVWIPQKASPALAPLTEKLVAILDRARRLPSIAGQYGVVWRDGKTVSPRRYDPPNRPRIDCA